MARRIRRTLGPLDLRSQAILRAVIEEYVTTAQPVGSQALVERYGLGVSSATVRNILAELETAGLLTHPAHVAPGACRPTPAIASTWNRSPRRVPLPAVEQLMIRHQFGQVEFASEHWFRLAATTLAGLTRSAGIATPAKPAAAHIRRVDLVVGQRADGEPHPRAARGRIKQAVVTLDEAEDVDQADPQPRRRSAQRAPHRPRPRPRRRRASSDSGRTSTLERVAAASASGSSASLREYDAAAVEEVFSDGLLNVMEAPEFAQSDKLRQVFTALENRVYLGELVGSVASSGRIHVFIGAENAPLEMRDVSLVLAPYGRPGRAIGVVGVLGPTRMSYPQAIGTVRFVSGLMNELVDTSYA